MCSVAFLETFCYIKTNQNHQKPAFWGYCCIIYTSYLPGFPNYLLFNRKQNFYTTTQPLVVGEWWLSIQTFLPAKNWVIKPQLPMLIAAAGDGEYTAPCRAFWAFWAFWAFGKGKRQRSFGISSWERVGK